MRRPAIDRPLIFAHRGASKVAPENTLPAFERAIALGADGVELDVRYSSDSRLVVMHNPDLSQTTNGEGRVSAHTLKELKDLDAGGWFAPEFAGTRIPTLDEALDLLAGRCLVNIELKSEDMATAGMGRDVVAAVRNRNLAAQVVISSFNPFALRPVKTNRDIETAYLMAPDSPTWMQWGITRAYTRADGWHPEYVMVDANFMARARRSHRPVRVWTVDGESEMRRMIELGVDAIITNVPDRLRAMVESGVKPQT